MNKKIVKTRRISIICRNEADPEKDEGKLAESDAAGGQGDEIKLETVIEFEAIS